MIRYGIEDKYPSPKYSLEYRLSRGWSVRARPDLVFVERGLPTVFIEFKISGYLYTYPGTLVNAMEFAHQARYYPQTIHFTYARNLNKWFVFSTDEAQKNKLFIKHIPDLAENIENLPTLRQLLPAVPIIKSRPSGNPGSDKDSLVLDIKNMKQIDRWTDLIQST